MMAAPSVIAVLTFLMNIAFNAILVRWVPPRVRQEEPNTSY